MPESFVRPDVRAFLDVMKSLPRPEFSDELIAQMRRSPEIMQAQMAMLELDVGELGEVRDVTMPGPGGDMQLRMFDPRGQRGPGPVMVFYHGGGFTVGSIDSHASFAAELARGLDLPVVSVEYRLAPENPWPAAPDDAEAAARWIAANGAAFGREFTGLVLCGDSAGGALTVVTALALRDAPAALPVVLQVPIYPRTDATREYPSVGEFSDGFGLSRDNLRYFEQAYAADRHHWRNSAIVADQSGLPPTLVVTASLDPLRDEGRAYAARAVEAGVQVTYREMVGTVHGFCTYRRAIASASADLARIIALARGMLLEAQQAAG
jgi:acetyl esterase